MRGESRAKGRPSRPPKSSTWDHRSGRSRRRSSWAEYRRISVSPSRRPSFSIHQLCWTRPFRTSKRFLTRTAPSGSRTISSGAMSWMAKSRLRVSRTKAPPGLRAVQKRSSKRRSSSSVKKPMLEKRFRARSNSPENSMSRMSWRTSWRGSPAPAARSLARWSSVSERSTPVTSKPRRARASEWRPNPQGASRIRPPAAGATWPRIQPTSDSASTSDSRPREMVGHDSSKNRLSNTAALYRIRSSSNGGESLSISPLVVRLRSEAGACSAETDGGLPNNQNQRSPDDANRHAGPAVSVLRGALRGGARVLPPHARRRSAGAHALQGQPRPDDDHPGRRGQGDPRDVPDRREHAAGLRWPVPGRAELPGLRAVAHRSQRDRGGAAIRRAGRGRAGADAADEDVLLPELRDGRRSLRRLLDELHDALRAGHGSEERAAARDVHDVGVWRARKSVTRRIDSARCVGPRQSFWISRLGARLAISALVAAGCGLSVPGCSKRGVGQRRTKSRLTEKTKSPPNML